MATMGTQTEQSGTKSQEQSGTRGQEQSGMQSGTKGQAEAHKEGPVARAIEEQTAKLPSDIFLWAAGAAIVVSLGYQIVGSRRGFLDTFRPARAPASTFVGMWVPTILLLGIYNKIVKVAGSDREASQSEQQGGR